MLLRVDVGHNEAAAKHLVAEKKRMGHPEGTLVLASSIRYALRNVKPNAEVCKRLVVVAHMYEVSVAAQF